MWLVVYLLFAAAVLYLGWLARHWNSQLTLEREQSHDHPAAP
jgi:hypothetical protein